MAKFMCRSKLNNRDPFEMILKDVGSTVVEFRELRKTLTFLYNLF